MCGTQGVLCCAGQLPELNMSILMYVILGSATGIKILLYIYCLALKSVSGKAKSSDYLYCHVASLKLTICCNPY